MLRLYCSAHAGGSACGFIRWRDALDPRIALLPLERPGCGTRRREKSPDSFTELVSRLAEEITGEAVALYGHSLGGLVAFELAVRLEDVGRPARQLVISASTPPERVAAGATRLRDLPDDQLVARVARLGGTSEVLLSPELAEVLLRPMKAELRMASSYVDRGRALVDTPIAIFGGHGDDLVPHDALSTWRERSRRDVQLQLMEGDHFFPMASPRRFLRDVERLLLPRDAEVSQEVAIR